MDTISFKIMEAQITLTEKAKADIQQLNKILARPPEDLNEALVHVKTENAIKKITGEILAYPLVAMAMLAVHESQQIEGRRKGF